MNPYLTPRLLEQEFVVELPDGRMRSAKGWLEAVPKDQRDDYSYDNPTLQVRSGVNQAGITLLNYRCKGEIDELILLTREFYKLLRKVCGLRYKEPPIDTTISSWIARCLDEVR